MTNVRVQTVAQGLCVGCGICAAVCPVEALAMRDNDAGEIVATPGDGACSGCGLCLDVCPFRANQTDEDILGNECFADISGIQHTPEVGYWLACKEGYVLSDEFRFSRSSGGIASWFLCRLLQEGIVQAVVCIVPNPDPTNLFRFALLRTPSEVASASTSCYYPANLTDALRTVIQKGLRVAITALPCVAKALRQAMRRIPSLRDRVAAIVGLTCGQQRSKWYAEFLVRMAGGDPRRVRRVTFRKKAPDLPAKEYAFSWNTTGRPQDEEGCIRWSSGYGKLWCDEYFKINACNYCDDVFAELADVAFMDAWLDPWRDQPGGRNLVVVRRPEWVDLLEAGRHDRNLELNNISVARVIESQRGVLGNKRARLGIRLWLMEATGAAFIKKRVAPRKGSFQERFETRAMLIRQRASREAYRQFADRGGPPEQYQAMVDKRCRLYEMGPRVRRRLSGLIARMSRIRRFLGGGG